LGRGFLTGAIKKPEDLPEADFRRRSPRFQNENFYKNLEMVEKVKEIANEKNATPAQIALAWVLAQGDDIVPIPGTKHEKYLRDNLGSLDIVLSNEELQRLDAAAPKGATFGERYADMSTVNK
jgi:aryl-alcohol dehydrogenase-like predicted oxidoreductase